MSESIRGFLRVVNRWPRKVVVEHLMSMRDQVTNQADEIGRLTKVVNDADAWHRGQIDECRVAAAGMRRQIEQADETKAAAVQAIREQYEREVGDLKAELDRRMREHQHALNEKDKCIVRLNGVADGLERAVAIAIGDGT